MVKDNLMLHDAHFASLGMSYFRESYGSIVTIGYDTGFIWGSLRRAVRISSFAQDKDPKYFQKSRGYTSGHGSSVPQILPIGEMSFIG